MSEMVSTNQSPATRQLWTQSVVSVMIVFVIVVVVLVTVSAAMPGGGQSLGQPLYDPHNRDIGILADTNFTQLVYGGNRRNGQHIQLIQFYNSWCGHCISFAPTFKDMAKQLHEWRDLITVDVVDCAQDINTRLCRDMDINVYPTLKLWWFSPKADDKGVELNADERSSEGLQKAIIKWIIENWVKGVPREWPDLMPVSALTKDQFVKLLPIEKGVPVVLVVENEKSFVGREVILDLSAYQSSATVLRMLDTSEALLNQMLPKNINTYKLPFLLTIDNTDYTFKTIQTADFPAKDIRPKFVQRIKTQFIPQSIHNNEQNNVQQLSPNRQPEDSSVAKIMNNIDRPSTNGRQTLVQMRDLNNAIRYSLFQEVGLKKKLNVSQVATLRNYLSVLELHFPFQTEKMRTFIKLLNEWLGKKRSPGVDVDTDDMLTTMKIYEEYYHFPEMKPWAGCAGSESKYRGYPCSMWTLFHTLTVNEYRNTLKSQKWSTLHSVLYAMRDYIKTFFGCTYCAQHFQQMAKDLESELTYPNSSVIWLWRSHNRVNKRLHGDDSEDPAHPKRQYPTRDDCPNCYDTAGGDQFVDKPVFDYLLKHYSADNIMKDESEMGNEDNNEIQRKLIKNKNNDKIISSGKSGSDPNNSNNNNNINTSLKAKWNYSLLNNMDYSLILFLYFSSAAIILLICIYLKVIRRKRGQKFSSFKSSGNFA